MNLLAFEFSTDRRSVALLSSGTVLAEAVHEGSRHTPVFELVSRVLAEAGVERGTVDHLAVGLGPGSYTGVRIAISAVQGWRLGRECRVAGINSFDALARQITTPGTTWLAVDAQRDEFAVVPAAGGSRIGPIELVSRAELQRRVDAGQPVVGPEVVRRLGSGRSLSPSAADIGRIAFQAGEWIEAEQLAPLYLREAAFVRSGPVRSIPRMEV